MYTSSSLIERARSLADLANVKFITYDDELQSLNESYRDVYNWLTNANDDYFIKTAIITLTHSDPTRPGSYLEDLPEDFYKLRFIDFLDQGHWSKMRKFSLEARDTSGSSPRYRFLGKQLWVTGCQETSQIKIAYYPPCPAIPLPEYAYDFGTSIEPYNKSLVGIPAFTSQYNSLVYPYNGTTIRVESITNGTVSAPVTIYTSTGLSNVQYYKGYVYFLKGGEIYRATTNLSTTITPAAITSTTGTITDYRIADGHIIYSTNIETYECALDGSSPTLAANHASIEPCLIDNQLAYINGSAQLVVSNVILVDDVIHLTSDNVYLYYVNSAFELHRVTLSTTYAVSVDEVMREGVAVMGPYTSMRLPIISTDDEIKAISTIPDYEFDYPLNEVNEVIAYQCAIDFKRKQNADFSLLTTRRTELQTRIIDVFKRDEGLPERIGNAYDVMDTTWR